MQRTPFPTCSRCCSFPIHSSQVAMPTSLGFPPFNLKYKRVGKQDNPLFCPLLFPWEIQILEGRNLNLFRPVNEEGQAKYWKFRELKKLALESPEDSKIEWRRAFSLINYVVLINSLRSASPYPPMIILLKNVLSTLIVFFLKYQHRKLDCVL